MSDTDERSRGSSKSTETSRNDEDVDVGRRDLLKAVWVTPLAVTLASLPASPLHGATTVAATTVAQPNPTTTPAPF